MKKLSISLLFAAAIGTAAGLTACGSSGGGGGSPQPPPGTCVGANCPGVSQSSTRAYYTQNQLMAQQYALAGFNDNRGATMTVQPGFTTFLKEVMGICDRSDISAGASKCTAWASGYLDVIFVFNLTSPSSGSAAVTVRGIPNSYYNLSINYPNNLAELFGFSYNPQGSFNPLQMNMTVNPANENRIVELRANGPAGSLGYNKLIRVEIDGQEVRDGANYRMYYNGTLAAQGTLVPCSSNRCGNGS